jgi:hypothetical protein
MQLRFRGSRNLGWVARRVTAARGQYATMTERCFLIFAIEIVDRTHKINGTVCVKPLEATDTR